MCSVSLLLTSYYCHGFIKISPIKHKGKDGLYDYPYVIFFTRCNDAESLEHGGIMCITYTRTCGELFCIYALNFVLDTDLPLFTQNQ
jgi:hypothetical protein